MTMKSWIYFLIFIVYVSQVAFSCEPIGEEKGFVLLDSRYYCGELHCLLLHVDEQEIEESKGKKTRFVSVIDWITLEGLCIHLKIFIFFNFEVCYFLAELLFLFLGQLNEQNWSLKTLRQLVGGGSIDLAALEPSCTAIFVATDRPLEFTSDSENPIINKDSAAKS